MKIIRAYEPITIKTLVFCIYGPPGAGKTSLSFSASRPLLLDADNGAHRSRNRHDIIQVTSWADCAELVKAADQIKDYDTIAVDTVGRVLDFLSADIAAHERKGSQASGALSQQGFGMLKARFGQWLRQLRVLGKDIVLIAHEREERKEGGLPFVRPDIIGSSYGEILKSADCVGYLSCFNKKRLLDLNGSESKIGKNPVGIGTIDIPDLEGQPRFLSQLIRDFKTELGAISAEHKQAGDLFQRFKQGCDEALTAGDLEILFPEIDLLPLVVQVAAKRHLWSRAQVLGFDYRDGKFVERVA